MTTADALFDRQLKALAMVFEDDIRPGANYELVVEHGGQAWVSGQIPRLQGQIVCTGRVGQDLTLEEARAGARVSTLRALAILRQQLGSLARVERILRVTVYVQSAADFTQQSEVADACSDILYSVFAPNGGHTRTSVGVYQLPKNAALEIDLVAAVRPA
ncbi:RidA family protein [uncultured Ramlibacter sp.]|uniref:RidA family protein n=1 Tax=uncultured Ramlibacter sp. TaxID=260755 RepID=UPI0026388193|nr:RidA family protein [uncultured Ramlibacter sp.]